ncbi:hypothetical protein CK203_067535 [Vitis vinifera]|uniref:Uncharacterized protein n=1 Tax=Vitis vinifera TaxID=29760 RepID=A0A438EBW3_VITVI|nr:hypothetical protein CK203_067535 [Vitis vinifera]
MVDWGPLAKNTGRRQEGSALVRRRGWKRYGAILLREVVGPLTSLDLVQGVGAKNIRCVLYKYDMEFLGAIEDGFLCLGGYLEEGSNFGPHSKKRVVFGE